AAPDAEDDPADARVDRLLEELTGAAGRRADRIVRRGRDAGQTRRLGELDEGTAPVVRAEPSGIDVGSERPRDRGLDPVPAAGERDRVDGPLAAIAQRRMLDLVLRSTPRPADCQRPRDLDRGQRPLERVGGEQNGPAGHPAGLSRRSFRKYVVWPSSPSTRIAWSGTVPNAVQPRRQYIRSASLPLSVSSRSSQRPSARARSSRASISPVPIPWPRARRWTMTLLTSARWGEFGFREGTSRTTPTTSPSSRAMIGRIAPEATSGIRAVHQAAPSAAEKPRRKLTEDPESTESAISSPSCGMIDRKPSTSRTSYATVDAGSSTGLTA